MAKLSPFKPSARAFFREARQLPGHTWFDLLHGYIYARWTYLYIAIGVGEHPISRRLERIGKWFGHRKKEDAPGFEQGYHGKVLPIGSARELILINEPIQLPDLEQVIPYGRARSLILHNPERIVALECPCRAAREHPCLPMDVCLIVGDPFASFVREHHPNRSHWITRDEAISILQAEDERGHVHHAFFKDAMLGRFYAICNCCSCCCGAMQAQRNGTPMLASSGYVAQVDEDACIACGECETACPFGAIGLEQGSSRVAYETCMGCGVCVARCPQEAIALARDERKGTPLDIRALLEQAARSDS
jgi:Pyruvate/2-oxoacid:ferredoxin oxidoreductase delta subunit